MERDDAHNAVYKSRIEDRDAQIKELKAELLTERENNKKMQGELVGIAKQNKGKK